MKKFYLAIPFIIFSLFVIVGFTDINEYPVYEKLTVIDYFGVLLVTAMFIFGSFICGYLYGKEK